MNRGRYMDHSEQRRDNVNKKIKDWTERPGDAPWNKSRNGKLLGAQFQNGNLVNGNTPLWRYSRFSMKPDVDFMERHSRKLEEYKNAEEKKIENEKSIRDKNYDGGKRTRRRKSRRRSKRSLFF
jgi:hypothetical protein